jgi:2-keto-4-pentenoate hydratase
MSPQKIEAAAKLLLQARHNRELLAAMPADLVPENSAEAYTIQKEISAALGPIGGWKVGAKGPTAEPACAPMPANLMYAAPHSFAFSGSHGVEAEIAIRIKKDLPPRAAPYLVEDVRAAVDTVHPAIEIVGSRFAEPNRESPLSILADSLANTAFIYGAGMRGQTNIDQVGQAVKLSFDSSVVADVVGGNPAGDIWRLVAWLANHLASHHEGLRAGQIVTTGSCTGLLFPEPHTRVAAVFNGLGQVEALET